MWIEKKWKKLGNSSPIVYIKKICTKKRIVTAGITMGIIIVGVGLVYIAISNKKIISIKALSALSSVSKFLPIPQDEQKEIDVMNQLVSAFTKSDNQERAFLVLLQNNYELRPGGGFLGQYAIVKVKNGEVTSTFFEDANLLDQRITAKIPAPYPLKRMMQIKNWKFRDSNFSPDFPTDADKAKYFLRMAGKGSVFDGVIAVNTAVLDDILALTGPISVPGYGQTLSSPGGALKLEEVVEKKYILDPSIDTQNRKMIMKEMAPIIMGRLMSLGNISKVAELMHNEFKNRNIMVNFTDQNLQSLVEGVHWDGKVSTDWNGDYCMMVDANMGALKTDYYIKREISYSIDLTQPKPLVTLTVLYKNTATQGDWRTSDYHSYMRIYVPQGSQFVSNNMVSKITDGEEFGKTYFGFMVHVLIGGQTEGIIQYTLPENFDVKNYRLLVQKQSGVGDIPVKIHLKTQNGEYDQQQTLNNDLKFEFNEGK